MKYLSEKLNKVFETPEECASAEEAYEKELAERDKKQKALAEEKAARAKEVTDAYKAVREATKKFDELRNSFVNTYGAFHMTYSDSTDRNPFTIFEELFRF